MQNSDKPTRPLTKKVPENTGRAASQIKTKPRGSSRQSKSSRQPLDTFFESKMLYRSLFENMTEEVHFWKLDRAEDGQIKTWRLVDANPPALKTWGRTLAEVQGKTTDEIFGAGATEHYLPVVEKVMTQGAPYSYEDYFPHLDKHFRFTTIPLGEHFITTGVDISSIKNSQLIAEQQHAELEAVFNAIQDAVLIYDTRMRVCRVNPMFFSTYGFDPIGMHVQEVIERTQCRCMDGRPFRLEDQPAPRATVHHQQFLITRPDGVEMALETSATSLRVEGCVAGTVTVWHDITERQQAERQLRCSHDELEHRVSERTAELTRINATLEAEIAERKRMEQIVCESEQMHRYFFELGAVGMAYLGPDGRFLKVNDKYCELTGYSQCELVSMAALDLTHPDDRDRDRQELDTYLRRGGREFISEKRYLRKDGSVRWVAVTARMVFEPDGRPRHSIGIIQDITERKRAKEALRLAKEELAQMNVNLERLVQKRTAQLNEANQQLLNENEQRKLIEQDLRASEEHFRTMADALPQLAWVARPDGSTRWYNQRWYDYTGTTWQQMEGWGWQSVHAPEILPLVIERWKASLAKGEAFEMIFPLRGADGQFRPFLTRVLPFKDAQGRVIQWFGTNTDVQELKRVEEALRASEERYRSLVEVSPIAICVSRDNKIIFVNAAGLRLFGIAQPEQILGKPPFDLLKLDPASGAPVEETFDAGVLVPAFEGQIARQDRTMRDVEAIVCPFRDQGGVSLQILLHDVTEHKLLDRAVLAAIEQEQQRLGQELHDGLCQLLTATKFKISLLENKLKRNKPVQPTEARALEIDVNQAIEQARAMAHGLNPVKLVAQGLASALKELASTIRGVFQVNCSCTCDNLASISDHAVAHHLYRIAQEAVQNAIKHGRACNIHLELADVRNSISLEISNDGVGCLPTPGHNTGMGLQSMKARAELIGASLDIQPGLKGGTRVACRLLPKRDGNGTGRGPK